MKTCSRCHKPGHYATTCGRSSSYAAPGAISAAPPVVLAPVEEVAAQRERVAEKARAPLDLVCLACGQAVTIQHVDRDRDEGHRPRPVAA